MRRNYPQEMYLVLKEIGGLRLSSSEERETVVAMQGEFRRLLTASMAASMQNGADASDSIFYLVEHQPLRALLYKDWAIEGFCISLIQITDKAVSKGLSLSLHGDSDEMMAMIADELERLITEGW